MIRRGFKSHASFKNMATEEEVVEGVASQKLEEKDGDETEGAIEKEGKLKRKREIDEKELERY